jgi:hypothetical protein
MSNVDNLEEAVRRLTPDEFAAFRLWFAEYDAAIWDRQLEQDIAAGKLDHLAEEALRDVREGRATEL